MVEKTKRFRRAEECRQLARLAPDGACYGQGPVWRGGRQYAQASTSAFQRRCRRRRALAGADYYGGWTNGQFVRGGTLVVEHGWVGRQRLK